VKRGDFVEVTWNDAASSATLVFEAKRDHKAVVMTTRGWIVEITRTGMSIANEHFEEEGVRHHRGWTFIPSGMVVKVAKV
jgi:hypothetical protein